MGAMKNWGKEGMRGGDDEPIHPLLQFYLYICHLFLSL
jgi:hypothetical protein